MHNVTQFMLRLQNCRTADHYITSYLSRHHQSATLYVVCKTTNNYEDNTIKADRPLIRGTLNVP